MRDSVEAEPEVGAMLLRTARPHPRLRGHVVGYAGFEPSGVAVRRREVAWPGVVLIVGFDGRLQMTDSPDPGVVGRSFGSFVAGVHDCPVLTEQDALLHGVQVNLTPLGAYRLLGVPMRALANTAVELGDLLGREGRRLEDRVATAPDWPARYAVLDEVLSGRLDRGLAPSADVAWAWRRLLETAGGLRVRDLVEELGRSHRHVVARFQEQIGHAPKAVARILRFEHAMRLLSAPVAAPLAEIALAAGYYDQAHLNRDFRMLAGCSPTELPDLEETW